MRPASVVNKGRLTSPEALQSIGIDAEDWAHLRTVYKTYDENRERVIKRCRDVQKLSKQAVYSLTRGDFKYADHQLKEAVSAAADVLPLIHDNPALRQGAYSNAMEEYAEAQILRTYLREDRVMRSSELSLVTMFEYLGGLLDFTGELNRVAVVAATMRDKDKLQKFLKLFEELHGALLSLDVRTPWLRKKLGPFHSSQRKVFQALYELSLTECSLIQGIGYVPASIGAWKSAGGADEDDEGPQQDDG
eukprot:jgi/Chrzof1/5974/Cz16g22090.t1